MNSLQPFWHELRVHLHPDGISVAARDERTSTAAIAGATTQLPVTHA